jgi:hypothetical protein
VKPQSELQDPVQLANSILDRPNGDPDDDLAILARSYLRALEVIELLRKQAIQVVRDEAQRLGLT